MARFLWGLPVLCPLPGAGDEHPRGPGVVTGFCPLLAALVFLCSPHLCHSADDFTPPLTLTIGGELSPPSATGIVFCLHRAL